MRLTSLRSLALLAVMCTSATAGDIVVQKRYLHIPVARQGEMQMVHLSLGGRVVHYFRISLPKDKSGPSYWASIDVSALKGKTLSADVQAPGADFASLFEQSDSLRNPPNLYKEEYRPQYHFTPQTGWMNDPNGLVFFDGEYHLFYQHNPYGTASANKSWGHALSRDLVRWADFGDVLLPDNLGTIYSGSVVVDHKNTAGFGRGSVPPMVALYTSAGVHAPERRPYTQSLAYSTDRGRTWAKYAANPVIGHLEETNRDPKVFWHNQSSKWVMTLYLSRGKFGLFSSRDLKQWEKLTEVSFPDGFECPDLFELPVDGDSRNTRWAIWEGAGRHMIGRFDGSKFEAETPVLPSEWGKHCYAGQTWNDAPDGRRLFICWMRARTPADEAEPVYPDMPFNQQMSFPREFTLRTTPEGVRLFAQPAREIASLYAKQHRFSNIALSSNGDALSGIEGELFDIEAAVDIRNARSVRLNIRGTEITYDSVDGRLSCLGKSARLAASSGRLDLRVLVDRTSIEIFAAGGRYVMSFCFRPDRRNRKLALTSEGGTAVAKSLHVRMLKPALPVAGGR